MFVLLAYDVSTASENGARRLRRVAKECVNYGIRVQNSVFELRIEPYKMRTLQHKLEKIIDKENDSIRIYYLKDNQRVEVLGKANHIDVEAPLIL